MSTIADEILRLHNAKKGIVTAINTKLSQSHIATTLSPVEDNNPYNSKYSDYAAEIDKINTTPADTTVGGNDVSALDACVINDIRMYNKTFNSSLRFEDMHFYKISLNGIYRGLNGKISLGANRDNILSSMSSNHLDGIVNFSKKTGGTWNGYEYFYDSMCCALVWNNNTGVCPIKTYPGMLFQQFGLCKGHVYNYGESMITELIVDIINNRRLSYSGAVLDLYIMSEFPLSTDYDDPDGFFVCSPVQPTDYSSTNYAAVYIKDRAKYNAVNFVFLNPTFVQEISYDTFANAMNIAMA